MKKLLTFILMITLAIMFLANLNHIVALAINVVILYFAFKQYLKSTSIFGKLLWGVIGLIALGVGLGHFSAIVGLLAIGLFYIVYKDWKQNQNNVVNHHDPFTNFEQQWEHLNKNQF